MKVFTKDRDLLRPGITCFATEFISLESLIRYEADLKRMCTTNEWREFNKDRSRKSVGDKVSNLILTDRFWKKAGEVQTIMEPLVKVLKLVDQDKKPTLSIIYEAMNITKLAIKASVKQWEKYWEVIDRRWEGQLHRHLHATAYFLNPMFQYSKHFSNHPEIKVELKEVIKRLEPDLDRQTKAINEVKLFVDGQGEFGSALTKKAINQSLPAEWWNNYGDEGPHLQKIAVKILSQTCSSSGLSTNEEGRERDVDSHRKGKASRTISSSSSSDDGDNRGSRWGGGTSGGNRGVGGTNEGIGGDGSTVGGYVSQVDPGMSWAQEGENYYATQDTDHGYRPGIWEQRKHLERLTTFPSDDDYSSGHDYHRSNHHRIDEHLQNLGIGSRSYFRGVDDRSYLNFRDRDSSSSTFSRNDFNQFPMMHPERYSNIGTRASDSYGYDQSSSSSSIAYRGFGYYQAGVDPEQPSKPYFPDYGSSSQSSHPPYLSYEPLFQSYPHYGNCNPNLYARRRTDDDDDFEPLVIQHGIDCCILSILSKFAYRRAPVIAGLRCRRRRALARARCTQAGAGAGVGGRWCWRMLALAQVWALASAGVGAGQWLARHPVTMPVPPQATHSTLAASLFFHLGLVHG
ncbi:hypothetical protein CK203_010766 [Vitis vinifera]|uniref:HAT C-terminal dimerisation domain-containing protein n=1 Tax=Vitis vinifera TaxID=29760 RepID=A0A438JT76_VITVI|nr:hypothetical protein CK203_010766 [Vitis vinifera]